jgi:hypothetical protein
MQTKKRWLVGLALTGCLVATIGSLRADDDDHGGPPPGPAGRHQGSGGPVSLGREMGAMGRDYKLIRTQVSDSTKNASTMAAVLDLEQHTLAAKGAAVRAATTMPTADAKKVKQDEYEGDMVTLLRHELDLEEALLANENDKAVKIVADLHDLEAEGHKEFRPRRRD